MSSPPTAISHPPLASVNQTPKLIQRADVHSYPTQTINPRQQKQSNTIQITHEQSLIPPFPRTISSLYPDPPPNLGFDLRPYGYFLAPPTPNEMHIILGSWLLVFWAAAGKENEVNAYGRGTRASPSIIITPSSRYPPADLVSTIGRGYARKSVLQ
ncbi:hypothetical protein AG1IA_03000 [Rhizoctonia solani AG-1 IA]|uniref:Uncharacterized protein n=1 Tax=Thanatephorus cucumeris (strain AG1-IA) TaxID=983506 RepID=L8WY13_THACA|nr:hypothetical protein AG1IA_03000 [Rhizoctonia solani AG-1 IA]